MKLKNTIIGTNREISFKKNENGMREFGIDSIQWIK